MNSSMDIEQQAKLDANLTPTTLGCTTEYDKVPSCSNQSASKYRTSSSRRSKSRIDFVGTTDTIPPLELDSEASLASTQSHHPVQPNPPAPSSFCDSICFYSTCIWISGLTIASGIAVLAVNVYFAISNDSF